MIDFTEGATQNSLIAENLIILDHLHTRSSAPEKGRAVITGTFNGFLSLLSILPLLMQLLCYVSLSGSAKCRGPHHQNNRQTPSLTPHRREMQPAHQSWTKGLLGFSSMPVLAGTAMKMRGIIWQPVRSKSPLLRSPCYP